MIHDYRTIYCVVWNDDKFPFLSDDCQLVWFHLQTTPYSNPVGCYKASLESLAAEKRWDVARYRVAFGEGITQTLWQYDERHHVIFFPRFIKWKQPNNPNLLQYWLKRLADVPPSPLKAQCLGALGDWCKDQGRAFQKAFQVGYGKYIHQHGAAQQGAISVTVQEPPPPLFLPTDVNRVVALPTPDASFEAWWTVYPKKRHKGDAERAWAVLRPSPELAALIRRQTVAAAKTDDWTRENRRYCPHPATWLRAKGWEDLYEEPAPKKLKGIM
jgi:hypothetical protein